ncbi:MAG TPA: 6-phosphogluconolactonase [Rhizomicrobium sp.]
MATIAGELIVADDAAGLARKAAAFIAGRIAAAGNVFRIALSGGSTPVAVYRLLGADKAINWNCTEIFFGDERFVPPDSKDSNYRMVRETLLAGDHVHPRGLYPVPTDGTPDSAAQRYAEILSQQYGASALMPERPLFDLMLLGLGDDGHTASLLPGQPVLQDRRRWVAPVPSGRDEPRISLTYPAIESSRAIVFLVSGAGKAQALARARKGELPAGGIIPQGELFWFVDSAAAGGQ